MGIDHDMAMAVLRNHPNQWVRPGTNAHLLSYLLLAIKGMAIAVRDEDGYLFRLAGGKHQPARLSFVCDSSCDPSFARAGA
jgi:hypothetical protein